VAVVLKIFISYNHQQADWVKDALVPCLDAGGAEVIVDYRNFGAMSWFKNNYAARWDWKNTRAENQNPAG
jgi:hypothetical protein